MRIYRWFMPLLHLDAAHDLVQSIKLAEQIMGRGSERVLPPRLPLDGARRAEVIAMVEKAAATRPALDTAPAACPGAAAEASHLLLHRRSHRRQPGSPGCRRRAVAQGREA